MFCAGDIFVHEALALHVELEISIDTQGAAHVMGHGSVRAELHFGAGPHAHQVAVAGVADGACGVAVAVEAHELVGPRNVVAAHLHVVAVVARGHDDGFAVDFGVGSVGVVNVDACDRAAFVLNELLAPGAEHGLDVVRGGCGVLRGLACPLHVGVRGDGAVEVGVVLLFPVVAFKRGEALGADVVRLVGCLVGRRGGQDLVVGAFDEPVEVLAGVVVPIAQKLRVGAERHILHQLVDDVFLRSPLDAQVFLNLGTDDAEVAGHGYDGVVLLGLLLDDDDLGAFFRRSLCGCRASKAVAYDDNVAILFFLDFARNCRSGQEGRLEGHDISACACCCVCGSIGRFLAVVARCAAGKSCACDRCGHGAQAQEGATAHVLFHCFPPLCCRFWKAACFRPGVLRGAFRARCAPARRPESGSRPCPPTVSVRDAFLRRLER